MGQQDQPSASKSAGTQERRRHLRFLDEVRVRFRAIEGTDPSQWGRSRDLSLGGLCLLAADAVPVGSHLATKA